MGIETKMIINGIKGDLYPYQKEGVKFLLESGGRALLADSPGCIGGDEKIIVNRGGNGRVYTMRELYEKTTQGKKTFSLKGPYKRPFGFDPMLPSLTRSLTKDGVFRLNKIEEVKYSGVKAVFTIHAQNKQGKKYKINLTEDHEIATPGQKWIKAGKLKKGDIILTNGKLPKIKWCTVCSKETSHSTYKYGSFPGKCKSCIYRFLRKNTSKGISGVGGEHPDKSGYILVTGLFFHPTLLRKRQTKSTMDKGMRKHVLVYEACLNNVSYEEWINFGRFNKYPKNSKFIDSLKYSVHHKNGKVDDNRLENLQLLTVSEHAAIEGREYKFTNIAEFFIPVEAIITKVENLHKKIDTYDLVMKDPNRNFIVNGVVVHNCGKTSQALGYLTHSGHKRTLIVCPASVKFSWANEIEKWTSLKSFIVDSKTSLDEVPFGVECLIVNYDILKKHFNELMKYNFNCLIGDEVQMIKSQTSIRAKAFKALAKNTPNVIMLTGTPVLNRPVEIFNVLNIIDPKTWNSWYSYAVKYCDGKQGYYGFESKGATNLPELHQRISRYFLRRTKEEVLPQLPPKNFIDLPMDLPKEERFQYDLAEENFVKYLKTFKSEKTDKEIARALSAEKLVKLNLFREISAMGKIGTAKELIDNILDADEKVLVFSSFNAPLKELADMYEENSVLLLGETPVDDRGDLVKQFQTNPNTKIFLGGTLSAGAGITLTAASNIIVLDFPWRPGDLEQLQNRAHRPGAEYECLNIYQIKARDTVDDFMSKVLKRKQEIIDQLIEGKEVEEGNLIDEYIRSLQEKYKK